MHCLPTVRFRIRKQDNHFSSSCMDDMYEALLKFDQSSGTKEEQPRDCASLPTECVKQTGDCTQHYWRTRNSIKEEIEGLL